MRRNRFFLVLSKPSPHQLWLPLSSAIPVLLQRWSEIRKSEGAGAILPVGVTGSLLREFCSASGGMGWLCHQQFCGHWVTGVVV